MHLALIFLKIAKKNLYFTILYPFDFNLHPSNDIFYHESVKVIKAAAADMRHFARSKFFGSLVHKKNFGLL